MNDLARLRTLDHLAGYLEADVEGLRRLLAAGDRAYRCYHSPILDRLIQEPTFELMVVQKALLRRGQKVIRPHKAAYGGVLGRSSLSNARLHHPATHVSKLDIRKFFPSVGRAAVRSAFSRVGLTGEVLDAVAKLTTMSCGLPTGAPTSPWVGNLVLWPLDDRLRSYCTKREVRYTRYIDDITLSGQDCEFAFDEGVRLLRGMGFRPHPAKSRRLCATDRPIVVTGYVVNGKKVKPDREYRRRVRKIVEGALQQQVQGPPLTRAEVASIQGHLAYLKPTNPELAAAYEDRLEEVGIGFLADLAHELSTACA